MKVVVFQVGSEEYAINIQDVVSIERMQALTAIPKMPEHITGMINIRDVVTPVIDLRIALGHAQNKDNETNRIILIRLDENPVGLIVDAATDVIDIPIDSIQEPNLMNTENHAFLKGVSKLSTRLLIILDIHNLLTDMDGFEILKDFHVA